MRNKCLWCFLFLFSQLCSCLEYTTNQYCSELHSCWDKSLFAVMAPCQFLFHVMSLESVPEISIAVDYIHVMSVKTQFNHCNGLWSVFICEKQKKKVIHSGCQSHCLLSVFNSTFAVFNCLSFHAWSNEVTSCRYIFKTLHTHDMNTIDCNINFT